MENKNKRIYAVIVLAAVLICLAAVQAYGNNTTEPGMISPETGPIYIQLKNDRLYTTSSYGDGQCISVMFGARGGNKLPDFIYFEVFEQENGTLEQTGRKERFLDPGTDWHAPYIVAAVSNGDGDMPEGYTSHFTGGNHAYNNDSTGTATARCDVLEFYVNGQKVSDYSGYADSVRIFWRNYVQGNNTKKEDGTGREILCEEHTLTFDGSVWKTEVAIIPLEDVVIKTYYGFQICGLSQKRYNQIQYENAINTEIFDVPAVTHSGNAECNGMRVCGNGHQIICSLDGQYGLGKRDYYAGNQGAFSAAYGKAYFTIIQGEEIFSAGTHYQLRGSYVFSAE